MSHIEPGVSLHSTAHYFLEGLNELGVDCVFCNLGTDHAPIIEEVARWEQAGRRLPKIVLCPHENVAMHMAAGYALMTGRGQAVLVHVDAGTANSAMGAHNLFRNRIPVLLIAGAAPFTSFGELTGSRDTYVHFVQQPLDQASVVRPYVKWEYTLPSGITTKETLRRAHSIMESEPKGPVYLMLPREILTQPWDTRSIRQYPRERFGPTEPSGADPDLVKRLAERLIAAMRPVLLTCYAGRDAAASDAIYKLAEFAGIRVIEFQTMNNISHESPCFGGFRIDRLADIDVGLLVDIDVPWIPSASRDNPSTFWAHIDVDVMKNGSPMWTFAANLRIQGKSSRILGQLLEAMQQIATPDFHKAAASRLDDLRREEKERRADYARIAADRGRLGEINPHYICAELGKLLDEDDIVLNEAVTQQVIPNMHIPRPRPGTMISNAGGGLGASGGMALGVKLARPDRVAVQIVGDGSLYFNNPLSVLAVSKQYALPIFTLVLDNSGWAAVKGATLRVYPEGHAKAQSSFQAQLAPEMDFSKITAASGAYGEKLVDPESVPGALQRCLDQVRQGRSALLHACTVRM